MLVSYQSCLFVHLSMQLAHHPLHAEILTVPSQLHRSGSLKNMKIHIDMHTT